MLTLLIGALLLAASLVCASAVLILEMLELHYGRTK
jgi:hypothetical protein